MPVSINESVNLICNITTLILLYKIAFSRQKIKFSAGLNMSTYVLYKSHRII